MNRKDEENVGESRREDLPISPPQESTEAFARIGLVNTNHPPGPAVEPLLGGGEGGRVCGGEQEGKD